MSAASYLEKTNISVTDLFRGNLQERVSQSGLTWLDEKILQISQGATPRVFFTAFSAVPRYTHKHDLELTTAELNAAEDLWFTHHWSIDQVARTLLVLSLPQDTIETYLQVLEQVFNAADMGELVALYQALPLLPYPERHRQRAAEGLRSNVNAVFNAIAMRNPYPAAYFDEPAWNQMVLKALFVGSPLHLIHDLSRRANPELARMAIDYAQERCSASRTVSPELWQLVEPFTDAAVLTELKSAIARHE